MWHAAVIWRIVWTIETAALIRRIFESCITESDLIWNVHIFSTFKVFLKHSWFYWLTAAEAGQVNRKENTVGSQAGCSPESLHVCTQSVWGLWCRAGFPVPLQTPMNSAFREILCKALSLKDRTHSCLHVPSFEHQQTCTQSAIEGEQAGLSLYGGERIQSSVFLRCLMLLDWL